MTQDEVIQVLLEWVLNTADEIDAPLNSHDVVWDLAKRIICRENTKGKLDGILKAFNFRMYYDRAQQFCDAFVEKLQTHEGFTEIHGTNFELRAHETHVREWIRQQTLYW